RAACRCTSAGAWSVARTPRSARRRRRDRGQPGEFRVRSFHESASRESWEIGLALLKSATRGIVLFRRPRVNPIPRRKRMKNRVTENREPKTEHEKKPVFSFSVFGFRFSVTRFLLPGLMSLAIVLFFARLGERSLWSMEVRWGEIPREMLDRGDF